MSGRAAHLHGILECQSLINSIEAVARCSRDYLVDIWPSRAVKLCLVMNIRRFDWRFRVRSRILSRPCMPPLH